ncbi:hypothetical protein MYCTH_2297743 [Thermothelomyces thermophilus ATCC 42464]|uniref:RBR-type E3 ubiquitin transferase n=1 Tax=Thermothelomyces thermophilus (strain ATCC 42464 / BCRC 31852 / DSM 1799) TaxID=573729 RepID=G2Q6Y5_THET4|nr:uncharacterized protein MYCTH_2297743 [Thermothelomyces thermophilus ATCC 42464]AEO54765.1 hypothetical protein MYCTH_2297743 [Thermothelomyces thermophilus ATCC 42464]
MSPMARPSLLLDEPVAGWKLQLPELADADYVREVLARSDGATEADIEHELVSKAAALRIELPASAFPFPDPQERSHEPRAPGVQQQQQNSAASTGSDGGSADCSATLQISDRGAASPGTPATATITRETTMTREATATRRRSRSLSFSQYERYISQVDPALEQSKFQKSEPAGGIAAKPSGKKGVRGITRSITARLRRRKPSPDQPMPCICCREDFLVGNTALHTIPCGHCYCRDCLTIMVEQSMLDESKMPPRCCTQPIPAAIIKTVLPREKQQLFLKAVVQYSTPWEARVFCPNTSCGEFIPPASKPDTKHPFETLCQSCQTRVCTMCKRSAHQLGQDCPEDKESDAVLRMGERSGWRRCYKCRSLVELAQGCTHITCRCKAQFCYICGAVWDPAVGCPNFCNGEEEMERRRVEEEARRAELEAEKEARQREAEAEEREKEDAERRTRESPEFRALRAEQEAERARFGAYERRVKEALRARQQRRKVALADKFSDLMDRMRERHAKTEQHLEDLQVMAEIELQASLEEKRKRVQIKLRHMEDYCAGKIAASGNDGNDGNDESSPSLSSPQSPQSPHPSPPTAPPSSSSLPSSPSSPSSPSPPSPQEQQHQAHQTQAAPPPDAGSSSSSSSRRSMPQRKVTERDLEQLRQQYSLRDGMERRHRSQINGLREKQARSMEELVGRHEREREALADRRAEEVEDLAVRFANEEDALLRTLADRRARLARRWLLAAEVLRAELEARHRRRFAPMPVTPWPDEEEEEEEEEEPRRMAVEVGCA